jgi:GAF domain-containing protein
LVEVVRLLLDHGAPACAECLATGSELALPVVLGGGAQSAMGLPLTAGDQRLGAAFLVHDHPHRFTPEEVALCEQVASQVALAVAKARLDLWNRQRVATLLALHETGIDLAGELELDPLLRAIVDRTHRLLDASLAGLYLAQPDGSLVLAIGDGPLAAHVGRRVELGVGASGEAAASGAPRLVDHYARWSGRIRLYDQYAFGSVISAPMVWHGRTVGVLFAEHDRPGRFGPRELEVAALLAAQAAAAVASARLYEDLERAFSELEHAYDATLEGWVRALDLRDKETEGHTQRVSRMAVELARAMGVPEGGLVHVRRGALLHDIGKIGIPDAILLKPGPLNGDETRVMRRHAELAHAMLASIPHLAPALAIPFGHHERWDGSGYPRGLQGEEIPLAARLFAVIDVWDALSHDRHYRRAWPQEEALQYLRDHAGTLFDPRVVEAFLTTFFPPGVQAACERGDVPAAVVEDPSSLRPSG